MLCLLLNYTHKFFIHLLLLSFVLFAVDLFPFFFFNFLVFHFSIYFFHFIISFCFLVVVVIIFIDGILWIRCACIKCTPSMNLRRSIDAKIINRHAVSCFGIKISSKLFSFSVQCSSSLLFLLPTLFIIYILFSLLQQFFFLDSH